MPHAVEVKFILCVTALSDYSFFWGKKPKPIKIQPTKETPGLLEKLKKGL